MPTGTIIVLNGTTSAGKSSIVHALQAEMDEPYLEAGMDKFLYMLPRRYLDLPLWAQVFDVIAPNEQHPNGLVKAGDLGHRLMRGMHHAIADLSRAGYNVAADHVFFERAWLDECAQVFDGLPVWLIAVRCPLEVVEQRERARGDRTVGAARGQYKIIHAHGMYDFEVDTSLHSAVECARLIRERMLTGPPPDALLRLKPAK
jgi:chloramphenicol 3-O phosphotransferase